MSGPEIEGRELTLVVAMTPQRVIGLGGALPWHEPEDLKHFRRVTMGHAIVLGRRTWESIRKALPGRKMIVVSRRSDLELPAGVELARDLDTALDLAYAHDPAPCVIGGGEIYSQALPLATRIELTIVDQRIEGDTYFPELVEHEWRETERRDLPGLSFRTLERQRRGRTTA